MSMRARVRLLVVAAAVGLVAWLFFTARKEAPPLEAAKLEAAPIDATVEGPAMESNEERVEAVPVALPVEASSQKTISEEVTLVRESGFDVFPCSSIQLRDARDGAPLPWFKVRVHAEGQPAVELQPDADGLVKLGESSNVERVELECPRAGGSFWLLTSLEQGVAGLVVASAPLVLLARFDTQGIGSDELANPRISSFSYKGPDTGSRSLAEPLPSLVRDPRANELVVCIPELMGFPGAPTFDGGDAQVTLVSTDRPGSRWIAELRLPRYADSPPVPLKRIELGFVRVSVRHALTDSALAGVNVAMAASASGGGTTLSKTNDEGTAEFSNLASGPYRIFVRTDGFEDFVQKCAVDDFHSEFVARLTPFSELHSVVIVATSNGPIEAGRLNVTIEGKTIRSILRSETFTKDPAGVEGRAMVRFDGIPGGEYQLMVCDMIPATSVIASRTVSVPESSEVTFDLGNLARLALLTVTSTGCGSGRPMEFWAQGTDGLHMAVSSASGPEMVLRVAVPSRATRWMLCTEGCVPYLGTSAEWSRSGPTGDEFAVSVSLHQGWGATLRCLDGDEQPVPGVRIAIPSLSGVAPVMTDGDGFALLATSAEPDSFPLRVQVDDGIHGNREVSLTRERFQIVDLP